MQLYTFFDVLFMLSSIAGLVLGIVHSLPYVSVRREYLFEKILIALHKLFVNKFHQNFVPINVIGVLFYFLHPFISEGLANLFTRGFDEQSYAKEIKLKEAKFADPSTYPIIYHNRYNVTACGIEKLHPFDAQKYGRVYQYLKDKKIIKDHSKVFNPTAFSRKMHQVLGTSKKYLFLLSYSYKISGVVELPVCFLPSPILRWRLLESMDYATQGSVDGGLMALQKGWAFNLSGGYHHAHSQNGGGFCVYPDITLTIQHLRKFKPKEVKRVMIIDLDAHQGNGHERDFINDENIFIADAYNHSIYPNDTYAKKAIKRDISVYNSDNDSDYLRKLKVIESDVQNFRPDFILYNAGTDIIEGDPLGNLNITPRGIISRDQLVFQWALRRNIPILMVLSGGYQRTNAQVIADSIENLIKNEQNLKSTELNHL